MNRVSVVIVVFNQLPLTRACLESLKPSTIPFDLVVVDNGSTDGTQEFFHHFPEPFPLRYHRNSSNLGLIRALNQGWRIAGGEFLCFLHNDTEMLDPEWLAKLVNAAEGEGAGLVGLYGVRSVRRDGRYVGRTIVHALDDGPTLRSPVAEVAAVDGVCLFLGRSLLAELGGFDESYGFFHGYDRDLSFQVREAGRRCFVVNARFVHRGGGTRTSEAARDESRDDLAERRQALAHFTRKWKHRLPADVRPRRERLRDWIVAKLWRWHPSPQPSPLRGEDKSEGRELGDRPASQSTGTPS